MGKVIESEDAFPFHIRSTSGTSIRKTCQVGGGGVRWAVGRGVVKESKKKNGISVYMRSMNGISNRRTCQVEGEAQ